MWDETTGLRPAGTLAHARQDSHTLTLLPDGRVLVVGGFAGNWQNPVAEAEQWDPVADSFSAAATLAEARGAHTATLLQDGTVLVAGGWDGVNEADLMASTEQWVPGPGY